MRERGGGSDWRAEPLPPSLSPPCQPPKRRRCVREPALQGSIRAPVPCRGAREVGREGRGRAGVRRRRRQLPRPLGRRTSPPSLPLTPAAAGWPVAPLNRPNSLAPSAPRPVACSLMASSSEAMVLGVVAVGCVKESKQRERAGLGPQAAGVGGGPAGVRAHSLSAGTDQQRRPLRQRAVGPPARATRACGGWKGQDQGRDGWDAGLRAPLRCPRRLALVLLSLLGAGQDPRE